MVAAGAVAVRAGVERPEDAAGGETVVALVDSSDFLGINFYTRELVHFDLRVPGDLFGRRSFSPTGEMSDLTSSGAPYSECVPDSLEQLLRQLTPCGKPIYITECGLPDASDVTFQLSLRYNP